ncbi:hypothetical protein PISMIDRAFT_17405 [Pisolithus microcarpus 441]|uniref:Uncharacterized protein n=1 Tax=Pisolithus microcarpus 441 TaxID=765257 RepID=A0A0C9YKA0_9AGAM|nr:hypothetical protein PISMIDRAFT_17405 [Pisolithus microcarpus 441]
MLRGDYKEATPISIKLLHFHEDTMRSSKSAFRSMKLRRGNHDSIVLRRLHPRDVAAGDPETLLVDEDMVEVKGEVARSDKLPADAEANVDPDKYFGADRAGESEEHSQVCRSSSGRGCTRSLTNRRELEVRCPSSPPSSSTSPIEPTSSTHMVGAGRVSSPSRETIIADHFPSPSPSSLSSSPSLILMKLIAPMHMPSR